MQHNHDLEDPQILNGATFEDKHDLQCDAEVKEYTLEIESDTVIKDFIKREDNNSENQLLIDEKTHAIQNNSETAVIHEIVKTISETTSDIETCKLCGKTFEKSVFQQHFDQHFIKCIVCLAVFSNKSALDDHSKEVHGATPEQIKVFCICCFVHVDISCFLILQHRLL